jgi:hypothetical protein
MEWLPTLPTSLLEHSIFSSFDGITLTRMSCTNRRYWTYIVGHTNLWHTILKYEHPYHMTLTPPQKVAMFRFHRLHITTPLIITVIRHAFTEDELEARHRLTDAVVIGSRRHKEQEKNVHKTRPPTTTMSVSMPYGLQQSSSSSSLHQRRRIGIIDNDGVTCEAWQMYRQYHNSIPCYWSFFHHPRIAEYPKYVRIDCSFPSPSLPYDQLISDRLVANRTVLLRSIAYWYYLCPILW